MCTFARENDTGRYELYIYITTFPAYLLGILPLAEAERREGAGHCRCAIRLAAEGTQGVADRLASVHHGHRQPPA